jgi:hypothetical protein
MRGHGRLRPSPSMAVAFAALMVALGGTSYAIAQLPANSVGTKQLKKNAVNAAKVKDRSLLAKDFKSGQLPRGAQGPRGAAGPAGPAGPPGPSGATNVTVRAGSPGVGSSTASCQGAERAVGGGGFTPELDGFLWDSSPNVESGTPTGWIAQATLADGLATEAEVTAYVICAAP